MAIRSLWIMSISMCMNILRNKDWYRPVPAKFLQKCNSKFYEMVYLAYLNNIIPKHIWEFICTRFPIVPTFYALPKVHKNNPPGRPIVSGNGSLTENFSQHVDKYLRPYVVSLPSYIRDFRCTSCLWTWFTGLGGCGGSLLLHPTQQGSLFH